MRNVTPSHRVALTVTVTLLASGTILSIHINIHSFLYTSSALH